MEIEKQAVEAATKYADINQPINLCWRAAYECSFIDGVKWERERMNAIVKPLVEALNECHAINLRQYGGVEMFYNFAHETSGIAMAQLIYEALENYKKQTGEGK